MYQIVSAVNVTVDVEIPLYPVIVRPDLEQYPEWAGDFGAHLSIGEKWGSLQLDFSPGGYDPPARILARIAHLEAACAALRAALMAAASPVTDTPLGLEDDVAGEAVEA